MNNIHAPTVASGEISSQQDGNQRQMSLQELIAEKDRVWSELSALGSVLDSVRLFFLAGFQVCNELTVAATAWCDNDDVAHNV